VLSSRTTLVSWIASPTHTLAFEGESRVVFFSGNYQEYEADKVKRLARSGEAQAPPLQSTLKSES